MIDYFFLHNYKYTNMSTDELLYSLLKREAQKEEIINLPIITLSTSDEKYDMQLSKEFIQKTNSLAITNTETTTNSSGKEYKKNTYTNNRIAFVKSDDTFLAIITGDKKVFDIPTIKINLNGTVSDVIRTSYTDLIQRHFGKSLEQSNYEITIADGVYIKNGYTMVPLGLVNEVTSEKRRLLNNLQQDIDDRKAEILNDFVAPAEDIEKLAEQLNHDREVHVTATGDSALYSVLEITHDRD